MQVSIADVTAQTKMFSLAGPTSTSVLEGLGATAPASNQVVLMGFQNSPVVVAAGSGLSGSGFTLVADEQAAGELWRSLTVKAGTISATPFFFGLSWQICFAAGLHDWSMQLLVNQYLSSLLSCWVCCILNSIIYLLMIYVPR